MKRMIAVVLAVLFAISLSSCSMIRNRIAGAIKSAAIELSLAPSKTNVPTDTMASKNTSAPEDTSVVEDVTSPEPEQSPPPEGNVSVEAFQAEIPEDIPFFNSGIVDSTFTLRNESSDVITYSLKFDSVKKDDIKAYEKAMIDAGFEINRSETNSSYTVSAVKMKGYNISAMISVSYSNGSCYYTLVLYTAKK